MPRIATIGAAASGAFGFENNALIPVEYLLIAGGGGGGCHSHAAGRGIPDYAGHTHSAFV